MSMTNELLTPRVEVIEKQMAMLVDDKETDTKSKKEKLYQKDKLSTQEVVTRLSNVKWNLIPPPSKNKGSRG
jgi:phage host-nuclease inhibitor protein Gam